jgi:hypothetical protein
MTDNAREIKWTLPHFGPYVDNDGAQDGESGNGEAASILEKRT